MTGRYHCGTCGGSRTEVFEATLDERYPLIVCEDCKKKRWGISDDIWDRKVWEQRQIEATIKATAARGRRK